MMWSFFVKDPLKDFNYEIGEEIVGLEDKSIWKLHKARRKNTTEELSVFIFDLKNGSEIQMDLAKATVKRLKTLRHPNILTYVDSLESEKIVYLVTEYVRPLENYLQTAKDIERRQLSIAWGLHQLLRALSFCNNDCGFAHHNINQSSIFVNQAEEWKLGGVEYMCKHSEQSAYPIKIIPQLEKYNPPEMSDSARLKSAKSWSADIWGLGCLIWELFNGCLGKPTALKSPGKIPKVLIPLYCEMVGANPTSRPNPNDILHKCKASGGYMKNTFIDTLLFLEEIQIKEATEKSKFFSQLPQHMEKFPEEICRYKILPQLLSAFEYGSAGPTILTPIFKLGKLLTEEEYQKKIVPCVVKLFSSTDRATRAKLLQQLEFFVDHLHPSIINSQVFPEFVHGFTDTNATIREITVKSVLHIAPKLNHNNLNVELMKHFARLQAKDPEGGIRTNTTVCLGKIAHHLHPETRKKVLAIALTRAMRDPFPPARSAGILAIAATQKFYSLEDAAMRILPALCQMIVDPEKPVRDPAFKAIKGFLGKLEKVSEDPTLAEQMESEVNAASSTSTADLAIGWAGWAVTSITSKLYKSGPAEKKAASAAATPRVSSSGTIEADKKSATVTSTPVSSIIKEDTDSLDKLPSADADSKNDSESDYDEDGNGWAADSWGEMSKEEVAPTASNSSTDGWDTGWSDADFAPVKDTGLTPVTAYDWESKSSASATLSKIPQSKSDSQIISAKPATKPSSSGQDGWEVEEPSWDADWDGDSRTTNVSSGSSKTHPSSKEEREQKRLQRKKELDEKRAMRQTSGGPMKLGERKKHGL